MSHLQKLKIEDLQMGSWILINHFGMGQLVRVNKNSLRVRFFYLMDPEKGTFTSNRHERTVSLHMYLGSQIESPDFNRSGLDDFEAGMHWSVCEQYYGISHLGSEDPCPLRQLAFKILKGDKVALDAARDILKS
jgi:hypothetical protein